MQDICQELRYGDRGVFLTDVIDSGDDETVNVVYISGQFSVDEESGIVTALVSLDRESVGEIIRFHVVAVVRGYRTASHALVLLTVVDVDDERPSFVSPLYSFSLPENVAVGSFAGVVVAVDRDSKPFADFRYELVSSTFAIDARSGVIVTRAPLDREAAATHRLTVSVRSVHRAGSRSEDGHVMQDRTDEATVVVSVRGVYPGGNGSGNGHVDRTDEATVIVKVDDVNDNAPYFRFPLPTDHTLTVSSAAGVGSTVGRVVAVDPDAGDNARLTYYLVTAERRDVFRLTADSGELKVSGNLSALVATAPSSPLRHHRLRFVVGVRDGGRPSRSATGVLTVQIGAASGSAVGNASSVGLGLSASSQSAAGMSVDGSVVAAIAAIAGCLVATLVFSVLAVTVHRRAATAAASSTSRGGGGGGGGGGWTASSRAAWSKVATTDLSGVDSPLYSAVVNSATTANVAGRTSNGKMSEPCCEGPDIILTLESEPVNYAVSALCAGGGGATLASLADNSSTVLVNSVIFCVSVEHSMLTYVKLFIISDSKAC